MHPIAGRLFKYGILLMLLAGLPALSAQEPAGGGPFKVQFGKEGISSLRYAGDKYDTECIAPSRVLGHVMIRYQMGDNAWQQFSTSDPKNKSRQTVSGPADALQQQTMIYNESGWDDYYADLELTEKFRVEGNKLSVHFGKNLYTVLEFFVTQPLETLIKERAAFIVSKQQHRDPAKWYNGLFSEWDMRGKVLRSPEDTDGLRDYMLASDDPGLCKAPFVAGKNVDYPDAREIEAVEYYLKNYVWGKLQMTEKEKYPYAVYGIDHWKINRDGFAAGQPIRFDEALNEISFTLENRAPGAAGEHTAEMTLSGLPGQSYEISLDGTALRKISGGPTPNKIALPVGKKEARITIKKAG
jgi:hypothetical protein